MITSTTLPDRSAVRRDTWRIVALVVIVGTLIALAQTQPGYTDAAYYLNNALRLAHGQELTDATIWTYIGLPPNTAGLPIPAFLYWQPLTSILESIGVFLFGGAISGFHAAQIGVVICYAGLAAIGYRLGARFGTENGTARFTGWIAALLTMFSGYFMPYWGSPDTFALFGLVGALCLFAIGEGCDSRLSRRSRLMWWVIGGACAGLAALTRADGLLLLVVLIGVAVLTGVWPGLNADSHIPRRTRLIDTASAIGVGIAVYILVTLPWALHNLATIGSVLPIGGLQTAWMRDYSQIAAYPPNASLSDFLSWGVGNILRSRIDALIINAQTLIAVEGLIVLTPFMLIGAWVRRTDRQLWGFFLYAIGLHLVMTFVFALPGARGGLFHSSAALIPFWAALGAIGLSDVLNWIAKRRRRWKIVPARRAFSIALVGWAIVFSLWVADRQIGGWNSAGAVYRQIGADLPRDAIVMVNDPPMFYYQTGLSGIVVPDAPPQTIEELAFRFHVGYLILDQNRTESLADVYDKQDMPPFLQLIGQYSDPANPTSSPVRVYRIMTPMP